MGVYPNTLVALVDDYNEVNMVKHYFTILDNKDRVLDDEDVGVYIDTYLDITKNKQYFVFYNGVDD